MVESRASRQFLRVSPATTTEERRSLVPTVPSPLLSFVLGNGEATVHSHSTVRWSCLRRTPALGSQKFERADRREPPFLATLCGQTYLGHFKHHGSHLRNIGRPYRALSLFLGFPESRRADSPLLPNPATLMPSSDLGVLEGWLIRLT